MSALRIAQVGLGGFGRNWAAQMIPQVTEVELVGSADVAGVSREQAIKDGVADPATTYESTEQLLEATDPDALLVTASLVGHVPAVRAGLEAGKHVLVEKPFAPSVEEARELVELADAKGLVLAVSQNYRFFPAIGVVRDLIAGGELGDLHAVNIDFRRMSGADGVRTPHHHLDEPLLVDMSIHHFDLMHTLLGQPRAITTTTWDPQWSLFSGPSEGVALVDFDGYTVSYRGSWVSHGAPTPWAGEWQLDFADGQVRWTSRGDGPNFGAADDEVIVRQNGKERSLDLPTVDRLDRAGSLTEFARAITEGREPQNSGRDNLASLALTYASVDSARTGTKVTL